MKISLKGKSIIKKVALALAGVAALTAVGFGVKAIVDYTKNDLKTISPSFEVGNLGADGKFVDDKSTLYTKDAFKCDGLQIKLDFDNQINYQIFYYDDLDNFIESTDVLSEAYSGGLHDSYARLVITPTDDEDDKISWTERLSYPKQMEIKVSKTQTSKYFNVLNKRLRLTDKLSDLRFVYGDIANRSNGYEFIESDNTSVTSMDFLSVKGGSKLTCSYVPSKGSCVVFAFEFKDVNGDIKFLDKIQTNSSHTLTFNNDADYVVFVFVLTGETDAHEPISADLMTKFSQYITITK